MSLALACCASFSAHSALAPEPSSGTVRNQGDTLEFVGGPTAGANVSPTTGSPVCVTGALECEVFALEVAPPDGSRSRVRISIGWSDATNDLDIYLVDADGAIVGQAASAANPEIMDVGDLAPGDYDIQIIPFAAAEPEYTGLVEHLGESQAVTFPPVSTAGPERVIVGVIDSAINPYHEFYYHGGPNYPDVAPSAVTPEVLAELGVREENHITLTRSGDIAADIEADREFWDRVQPGELYWFVGTNVIAASYAGPGLPLLVPTTDKSPHGVGTSSAVLKANPEAVILFVETEGDLANDASHDLVFLNPAVDIISTSYGVSVSGVFLPEAAPFRNSREAVLNLGKLHFSSGGNSPGFTPGRAGAGPWWSIGVSGHEEGSSEGRTSVSGNLPDFVSDFTQELARCMDCERGLADYAGTSFSTPRAAGVASRVLLEARRRVGHAGGIRTGGEQALMVEAAPSPITNWFLRRALEQAAYVPDPLAYDPVEAVFDLGAQPYNPAAPWLQSAWGDLTADPSRGVVEAALTHLGLAYRPRSKVQGFCEFQTSLIEERKAYWDNLSGTAPASDPFIYCDSALPWHPASNDPGGDFDAEGDADADGIPNASDNCPENANQDQADADGDGYGDACDAPPPDADGDGVIDSEDNCPVDGNEDQQDTGGDGTGDACETPPQAHAQPGPGRTLVASFDGSAGPLTTPVVCLNPCGSGNDGFATFEFRYALPQDYRYERIEFVLSSQAGTQYSMEIFGPDTASLAFQGNDVRDGRFGSEAVNDGELAVELEQPDPGLYLAQIQEQLSGGSLPFNLEVYVTCPATGCEPMNSSSRGSVVGTGLQGDARGGAMSLLGVLGLLSLLARRRTGWSRG